MRNKIIQQWETETFSICFQTRSNGTIVFVRILFVRRDQQSIQSLRGNAASLSYIYLNIGYGYLDFYDSYECFRMYFIVFVR